MINTHKEFVGEIRNFVDKFELINEFKYLKDVERLLEELGNSEPRVLLIGLSKMEVDFEEYNTTVTYDFILSDEVVYEEGAIIDSETENMFCITALTDYLNHLADAPIELNGVNFVSESEGESSYTSVTGSFDFIIKSKASYWKKMEEYSV